MGRWCGEIFEVGFDIWSVIGLGDSFVCVYDFDRNEVGFG